MPPPMSPIVASRRYKHEILYACNETRLTYLEDCRQSDNTHTDACIDRIADIVKAVESNHNAYADDIQGLEFFNMKPRCDWIVYMLIEFCCKT